MSLQLVQHLIVNPDGSLPDCPDCLYAYILAGNGVFVSARRPALQALIPVVACRIAGLPDLAPRVALPQRVPAPLLEQALRLCRQVFPDEALFWFNWIGAWVLHFPDQRVTYTSAAPSDRHDRAGRRALIDLHSHARFSPFFSPADDRDETGFRIFAVIGDLHRTPTISVRVGVYSHYLNIPASTVFELPDGMKDIYEQEEIEYETQ
jgi:PRTRC genetic system protein A